MSASYRCYAAATLAGEVDEVLDFEDGFRLDVEFGRGVEGSCPGRLNMVRFCAEGNIRGLDGGGYGGVHICFFGTSRCSMEEGYVFAEQGELVSRLFTRRTQLSTLL